MRASLLSPRVAPRGFGGRRLAVFLTDQSSKPLAGLEPGSGKLGDALISCRNAFSPFGPECVFILSCVKVDVPDWSFNSGSKSVYEPLGNWIFLLCQLNAGPWGLMESSGECVFSSLGLMVNLRLGDGAFLAAGLVCESH